MVNISDRRNFTIACNFVCRRREWTFGICCVIRNRSRMTTSVPILENKRLRTVLFYLPLIKYCQWENYRPTAKENCSSGCRAERCNLCLEHLYLRYLLKKERGMFSYSFHPERYTAAGCQRKKCRSRCTTLAALFLWGCPHMLCRIYMTWNKNRHALYAFMDAFWRINNVSITDFFFRITISWTFLKRKTNILK